MKTGATTPKPPIRTAVIAAGGFGTRFLPFTKIVPKELLPIGDTPTIELLVKECINAGIEKIYIIVRTDSDLLKRHFSQNVQYEKYLKEYGKNQYLKKITLDSYKSCKMYFVKENENLPYGNARGLFTIQKILKKENSFLILFADDIVIGKKSSIKELIEKYIHSDCEAMVGVQTTPRINIPNYGNVKLKKRTKDIIESIIQKPNQKQIVSNLVVYSQLVVTPEIFKYLKLNQKGKELDIAIALNKLAQNKKVLAYKTNGTWVTIGDPVNYLKANLAGAIFQKLINPKNLIDYIKTLKF